MTPEETARHLAAVEADGYTIVENAIEGVLDKGCLISSLSSISIDPGEKSQPIHAACRWRSPTHPSSAIRCGH